MKVQKEMRMRLKVGLFTSALLVAATAARADLVVIVGYHALLPITPNQVVPVQVVAQGGEQVQGTTFRVQVGTGDGSDGAPSMTADIGQTDPSTIFGTNNSGINDGSIPQFIDLGTTTSAGTIALSPGDNLWGTITFDTTGLGASGPFPLIMVGTIGGDSGLSPFLPDAGLLITNGSVTIVPEPSSVVLGLFAVAGFGAVAIRRRRARNA
jgi:hypothetical protein